ncbi:membrane protein [Rhodococcus phage Reynauld]|uniref:Membrane protein n=1 Tax=Rhodococcus phage Reynauld TaxID=3062845 RepID=A0ACD4UHC0_9CAUD|nr:membrane protein [Rhodococcus phage Reynauld]
MKLLHGWALDGFQWIASHLTLCYLTLVAALAGIVMAVCKDSNLEAQIFTGAVTVVAWVFVLVYGLRSPWRLNPGGRALMYTSMGLAAVGTFLFAVWLFGDIPFRDELRGITMTGLLISMLYRLILALRVQHWERTRDKESEDHGYPG